MAVSNSVRFVIKEEDRHLLDAITRQNNERNMSLTIRQLIRDEAKRRGIETVSQEQLQERG